MVTDPEHVQTQNPGQDVINGQDGRFRVLVVDDDDVLRGLIEQSLTRAGCKVMGAREGGEGLQMLLSHRFDVVVSDLMMEPLDGITFLTEALRIWPWVGVLVLSGFVQDELRQRAEAAGVRVILEKPVSFQELTQKVFEEANRMRDQISGPDSSGLNQIQYQLSILQENTRTAIEATSLEQALSNLSRDLGLALPSIATAIMCRRSRDGESIMVGTLREGVSSSFLRALESLIRKRYQLLAGMDIGPDVKIMVSGEAVTEAGICSPDNAFTFPIIHDGMVMGMLAFVPPADHRLLDSEISFLYHAANHLTTVLLAVQRIRELAVRDELTGLYNRHHLQDQIASIWQVAERYAFSPAVMILDIDHFKMVNDNHGHMAGDLVLRELGEIVRNVCRDSDLIARYGGDEIVVVLPNAEPEGLGQLSHRLIEAVRAHDFCEGVHDLHCTVSIGASASRSADGSLTGSETLFARADEALYLAKRNGRDRSCVWTDSASGESVTEARVDDLPGKLQAPTVLVVDDDPSVLKIVELLLEMEGFSSRLFASGNAAYEEIKAHPRAYPLALIDLNLEDMNGLELLEKIGAEDAEMVKVVITGDATLDNAVNSLRQGAYDFIQKPIRLNVLRMTLKRAFEYHRLRIENQEYQQNLQEMVLRKSAEVTSAMQKTRDAFEFAMRAMVSMLDAREHATSAHSQRVQDITCLVARDFGFSESSLADLRQGALLHDIGKIATPDCILMKTGPLTEDEWEIMRRHVVIGYDLISKSPDLKGAAELMLCHHEAFDGSGYPNGLKGEQIPLGARIFAVVDSYDAMRSDRTYRTGMVNPEALEELRRHCGTQFDPAVVDVFINKIEEIEKIGGW